MLTNSRHILHIAIAGCLKAPPIDYGITPDTGGHISYLLGQIFAYAQTRPADHITIATRAFFDPALGQEYAQPVEKISDSIEIRRFSTQSTGYLHKEQLWSELDVFAEQLGNYLESLHSLPHIAHAHSAEAGYVAACLKKRFDLPYIFTGHSLGRVKVNATGVTTLPPALQKRIDAEEASIAGASAIIASSMDEATRQYHFYHSALPECIEIIPPGCDYNPMQAIGDVSVDPEFLKELRPFGLDLNKPPILAVARPVRKKNLQGLVELYGRSKALQEKANLIIFAGQRDDISDPDDEQCAVLREILCLIDTYNLYGKVALPKRHERATVKQAYIYTHHLRGIFVNPALNEPFGLTLLEAAAFGVPVVATDQGGPQDIVRRCGHGVVADPTQGEAFAQAMESLLTDEKQWSEYSRNGLNAEAHITWQNHGPAYAALIDRIVTPQPQLLSKRQHRDYLLATDIDNTLVGNREAVARFAGWQAKQLDYHYAVATGRDFHNALAVLQEWNAPLPEILICSVGSEVYYRRADGKYHPDMEWKNRILQGWQRGAIQEALQSLNWLELQPQECQTEVKLSYFMPENTEYLQQVETLLKQAGLPCSVIFSHGRFLDILPHHASKGHALRYVSTCLAVNWNHVIAAGDSGNDLDMLLSVLNPIIVANHTRELRSLRSYKKAYFSHSQYADGILEGIEHLHGDKKLLKTMERVA